MTVGRPWAGVKENLAYRPAMPLSIHSMIRSIEVLLAPAEFAGLPQRDLRQTVCVVFDVLRATSSMMQALANGAAAIIPVANMAEALALRQKDPAILLAGERNGRRIRAAQSGGVDFDLGNSPREFTPEHVRGRTIVTTTTNGTRALRACAGAATTLLGTFLNLTAVEHWIGSAQPTHLLLVGSGTFKQMAYEDALAAGALTDRLCPAESAIELSDSALVVRQLFRMVQDNLPAALAQSLNGRRLLSIPDLRDDVPFCGQRDTLDFVAILQPDGAIRKSEPSP
jgi:2-phosphosulfolactate phosphatase